MEVIHDLGGDIMKRKILFWIMVSILSGLLTQPVSFSEPMEYSDLVNFLITSWNQNVSKDELKELYGEPLYDEEMHLSYWDKKMGIQYTFYFGDGLLTSIHVSYSVSSKEDWSYAYKKYVDTENKLSETLGKRQGFLCFYNGDEYTASNVDCIVGTWSGNEINVLVAYNQLETKVSVITQITAAQ